MSTPSEQIITIAPANPVLQSHQRAERIFANAFARLEELLTDPGQWTKAQRADFVALSNWVPFSTIAATIQRK